MQDISLKIGTLAREIYLTIWTRSDDCDSSVRSLMTEPARLRPGNPVSDHLPQQMIVSKRSGDYVIMLTW